MGNGNVIQTPVVSEDCQSRVLHLFFRDMRKLFSRAFQWLPCNVSFPDGEDARVDSYMNNLHPFDHKDFYCVIKKNSPNSFHVRMLSIRVFSPLARHMIIFASVGTTSLTRYLTVQTISYLKVTKAIERILRSSRWTEGLRSSRT